MERAIASGAGRRVLNCGASLLALSLVAGLAAAGPAAAQAGATTPAKPASVAEVEGVVVTATRLTNAGFEAPTPTTVLTSEQLERAGRPNIFESVQELPSLMGSTGTRVGNGGTSEGVNGLSSFATRGLLAIRTLTLVDGQRVAPANINGVADVSLLPQLLIQRVDVVTGGASASYGSDAVGGVVNFITNTHFKGFKANMQGGLTKYGDGGNGLVQVAVGRAFLDDRFHVALSGEYYQNQGIPARQPGKNGGPSGREWFQLPSIAQLSIAQTPAGQSQYKLWLDAQNNQYSAYGLITAGPLQGTAFGPGGAPYNFQYGSNGVPNRTAGGGVAGCIGALCQGGELTGNVLITNQFDDRIKRKVGYARLAYDLGANTELFTSISYADVTTHNQTNAGAAKAANLTIQCDNAYLPASIVAACATNRITSFQFGVSNIIFPDNVTVEINRRQPRYVIGLNSDLSLFGKDWKLQSYIEHGETNISIDIHNVTLTPRYNAAIDAIAGPNGTIVCRNVAARNSGCVPLNVIGLNPINMAAWNYIAPARGPKVRQVTRQEAASIALSGSPFKNWAGEVSVAFGAEYREEAYKSRADWYGAGVSLNSPITPEFPADPVLALPGVNWYAGSFNNGGGRYNVKEAFGELGMPLFDNEGLGKLDFNVAGRITDYSTSGTVSTWKVGGVWDTPVDGVRFRIVRSRDVRAPNLSELFAAPISQNATVTNRVTGFGVNVNQQIIGNKDLDPEISANLEAGIVFRPSWFRGFSSSFDYYSVKIDGGISTLTGQQIVDLCQLSNNADACKNIRLTGSLGTADPPFVIIKPFNLAAITTRGIDLEASYQFTLDNFNIPGAFVVRGLATHVLEFELNTGVPGQPIIRAVGSNSGLGGGYTNVALGVGIPKWKGLLSQGWTWNSLNLTLTERIVSAGYINPEWVQCTAGCPLPTLQNPTIDNNTVPGAIYLDIGGGYKFGGGAEAYFKVDNVFDKTPPVYGSSTLYDYSGRTYRLGFRLTL